MIRVYSERRLGASRRIRSDTSGRNQESDPCQCERPRSIESEASQLCGRQLPQSPFTDPASGLSSPDFFANPPLTPGTLVQPSLIFPVACEFINKDLPHCAVIRPSSSEQGGAVATIQSFVADGLFFGQSKRFINLLFELAAEADEARREI